MMKKGCHGRPSSFFVGIEMFVFWSWKGSGVVFWNKMMNWCGLGIVNFSSLRFEFLLVIENYNKIKANANKYFSNCLPNVKK